MHYIEKLAIDLHKTGLIIKLDGPTESHSTWFIDIFGCEEDAVADIPQAVIEYQDGHGLLIENFINDNLPNDKPICYTFRLPQNKIPTNYEQLLTLVSNKLIEMDLI